MEPERTLAPTRTIVGVARWVTAREERAHAMKNQLSNIRLIGQLLCAEVQDTGRERLRRLDAMVCKLAALIEEELEESERRDTVDDERCEVDVLALFVAMRSRVMDQAESAKVTLTFDCEPATVHGIGPDLAEAMHNLIANALHATPEGGAVNVRTRVTPSGEHAWEVSDSGCGMPREVLARATIRRCSQRRGGSGLGFAIAATIVGAHGGLLEVSSCESGGTRLTVRLPARRPTL